MMIPISVMLPWSTLNPAKSIVTSVPGTMISWDMMIISVMPAYPRCWTACVARFTNDSVTEASMNTR